MLEIGSIAIEWVATGALVTILGALIRFAGWTWLLAGYSESSSPVPDDVVQETAGSTILRVGLAISAFGIIASVTNPPSYVGLLVGAAVALAVLLMVYRLNTWSPQPA